MKLRSCLWLLCLLVLCAGCYRATVVTGLPMSNEVISKPFASCWIYGLVPPSVVETAAKCPNGVAKVETQLSFVNSLVSAITFGIYTPMSIEVTCAEGPKTGSLENASDMLVTDGSSPEAIRDAFAQAAQRSMTTGHPVFVRLH